MKKIILTTLTIAFVGLTAFSCSSDDNDPVPSNPLVGIWIAETASYSFGGETHSFPYNVEGGPFAGCPVDVLTLESNHNALLFEHTQNETEECEEHNFDGNWDEEVVNVKGADRTIDFIDEVELILTYDITFHGITMPITVSYLRD